MARAAIDQPLVPPSAFPERRNPALAHVGGAARLRRSRALVEAGDRLLAAWQDYSDPGRDIIARSPDGTLHNAVTPIVRRRAGRFELDLVLRNNRTSAEHPMGIFHPHAELHHIKKENIGLIEAMGLFILPGRLENELAGLSDVLTSHAPLDERTLEQPTIHCASTFRGCAMVSGTGHPVADRGRRTARRKYACAWKFRDAGVFGDTLDGREDFSTGIGGIRSHEIARFSYGRVQAAHGVYTVFSSCRLSFRVTASPGEKFIKIYVLVTSYMVQ